MAKKKFKLKVKIKFKLPFLPIILSVILVLLLFLNYQMLLSNRFYPFTFVGDQNISFLTRAQAIAKISSKFNQRAAQKIDFVYSTGSFQIDLATSSAQINYQNLYEEFNREHSGTFQDIAGKQLHALLSETIRPQINLNISETLDDISNSISKKPQDAQLLYSEASQGADIQIQDGKDGLALDKDSIKKAIDSYLLSDQYSNLLPTKSVQPTITTNSALRAQAALENLKVGPLKLTYQGNMWILDIKTLITLLDLTSKDPVPLDKTKTMNYLSDIAKNIDQNVQEGLLDFDPTTKRVSAFKASQEGRKLDVQKAYNLIVDALSNVQSNKVITLPVDTIEPKIKTADVNNLGIKELLGRGISHFAGSIPNRIYNIDLTASKLNGVLIPPGQIFSFNQTVGDITAATGFKQAYVISAGRTVLGDGGGVCQDSTTLFRAVLYAGLPVVARTAHAYRVGYYEQGFPPGLDATVYYPSVDFQFKNDTPAYILIQAYTVGESLYMDLYGTSDGRVATVSNSVVTDQTPPPPALRQDDPTLPKGQVKQVDWSAWGANVYFKRTVVRNGQEIINETWRSSYKPWQAVYLVGTQ